MPVEISTVNTVVCVIIGFRRGLSEIFDLLGCYAA